MRAVSQSVSRSAPDPAAPARAPLAWVEIAKGLCIGLVVLMHATFGLEAALGAQGYAHAIADFAQPFRMPTFFALSGLFLGRALASGWRPFLERRVFHYLYFYTLWLLIQEVIRFPHLGGGTLTGTLDHFAWCYVEPFSTLWFLYALALFSLVTRLVDRVAPPVVLGVALGLAGSDVASGWHILDVACDTYLFFYAGYRLAPQVIGFGQTMRARPRLAAGFTTGWLLVNGLLIFGIVPTLRVATVADAPLVVLPLGALGVFGVIALATLLERSVAGPALAYAGYRSIVIYLAAFLPVAVLREAMVRYGVPLDVGTASLVLTAAGILLPLALERSLRSTPAACLFVRPSAALRTPASLLRRGRTLLDTASVAAVSSAAEAGTSVASALGTPSVQRGGLVPAGAALPLALGPRES
ncbi:acyltransferase family protein [Methylobacterium radiodurans]|uniref:Acyltransferase n=1 Tax=Methylobacterium radiodurans TaxID=2202828 RepID=A0A2U8VP16_9HYPH|nr:acyltransferase family protein [Methylobacterium radiodurans]AWN35347.1 acyltransferase [Methylobacterium radiodurans]